MPETNKWKLVNVITSTGKVHLAYIGGWKNGNVDPFCNYMSWRGDYFGQPWEVLKDQSAEVTCKNCLRLYNSHTIAGKLANFGNEMRTTKTQRLKKFLELSKGCKFRKVTRHNNNSFNLYRSHNYSSYIFKCNNPDFEKSISSSACGPDVCPHVGCSLSLEWEYKIKEKPSKKEVEDYENSRRVKKDQTP